MNRRESASKIKEGDGMRWTLTTSLRRTFAMTDRTRRPRAAGPGAEALEGRQLLSTTGTAIPGPSPVHSRLVAPGINGRLVYTPDARGNRIPDFSLVGYQGG